MNGSRPMSKPTEYTHTHTQRKSIMGWPTLAKWMVNFIINVWALLHDHYSYSIHVCIPCRGTFIQPVDGLVLCHARTQRGGISRNSRHTHNGKIREFSDDQTYWVSKYLAKVNEVESISFESTLHFRMDVFINSSSSPYAMLLIL